MLIYSKTILLPIAINLFKVKNKNTRKRYETCPILTKKDTRTTSIDMNTQLFDVTLLSFFNFEHILLLVTVSFVNFKLVNVGPKLLIHANNHIIFKYCINNFL